MAYLRLALKDAQGDVLSHNTIQVLPAPACELSSIHYHFLRPLLMAFVAVTAKEKERNLARFQRCPLPSVIFTGREGHCARSAIAYLNRALVLGFSSYTDSVGQANHRLHSSLYIHIATEKTIALFQGMLSLRGVYSLSVSSK